MDIKNEDGGKLWMMEFVGELLHYGLDESDLDIFDRVELLSNENPNKRSFLERIINYFDRVDEPFDELMEIIEFSIPYESVGIEERVKIIGKMDKRGFSFISDLVIEDNDFNLLNSACILYMVGARNNANAIIKIAIKSIIKNAFTPIIKRMEINKEIKLAISKSQSEKASKKRNYYYDEVFSVIKLTWEKYPCASKTGIIDALALHYKGKASRGAITTWIDESGLRPALFN